MAVLKFHKVIQAVPTEKTPNSVYIIRRGAGVDLRFTDESGVADFGLNPAPVNYYNSTGLITTVPKIWTGVVQATDGFWTADFSSAGFTTPPFVTATAEALTGTKAENANYACVEYSATTTTTAKGRAMNSVAAGLLAAMVSTNGTCKVAVMAIGI